MQNKKLLNNILAALGLLIAATSLVALILALKVTAAIPFHGPVTTPSALLLFFVYFGGMMIFGVGKWQADEAQKQIEKEKGDNNVFGQN